MNIEERLNAIRRVFDAGLDADGLAEVLIV